ncbi:MAG: response regulator, partial [Proteobacteria bacterium]|nr:response regulator [Pseudomonadota bacterium]
KKLEKWKSSQNRPKVLIAEPDKSNQEVFSNLMERWEFEPVFAKNGIELVTYGYFHQPQAILVGAELTKLTEHEAIQMLKTNPKTERLPIFLCRPAGSVTSPEKKKLLVDGTLKLPLDRASFQVALEAYQSKMKKFRKVAA